MHQSLNILYAVFVGVIFAHVAISYFPRLRQHPLGRLFYDLGDALLKPIRRLMPAVGGLDFSPVIGVVAAGLLYQVLVTLLK